MSGRAEFEWLEQRATFSRIAKLNNKYVLKLGIRDIICLKGDRTWRGKAQAHLPTASLIELCSNLIEARSRYARLEGCRWRGA